MAKNIFGMKRSPPGVMSVFKTDFAFMLGMLAPLIGWALYLTAAFAPGVLKALGVNSPPAIFLWVAAALSVLGWPVAWIRWTGLQKIFAGGRECQGEITSVWLSRDRGRVEFRYQLDGQTYQSGMALHRNPRTEQLQEGERVDILVDPDNPRKAILPQLFE